MVFILKQKCNTVYFTGIETEVKKSEHPRSSVPARDGERNLPQWVAVQSVSQVIHLFVTTVARCLHPTFKVTQNDFLLFIFIDNFYMLSRWTGEI